MYGVVNILDKKAFAFLNDTPQMRKENPLFLQSVKVEEYLKVLIAHQMYCSAEVILIDTNKKRQLLQKDIYERISELITCVRYLNDH